MQRRAWLLPIREGKEQEYRRMHAAVWPELIAVEREAGLKNHSCFVSGQRVIVYGEAEDIEATFNKILAADVKKRWDLAMFNILEDTDSAAFEEVFHFD